MPEKVILSQGTDLYYHSLNTNGGVPVKVVCITGIDGLGGARDQIDTTCLDNTGDRTYVGGLGNPGQVTVPYNVHKNEISHEAIAALKKSGEVVSWGIYSSDGTGVPTVDSNGILQPVPGRASLIFQGYVSDNTYSISGNDIWKGQITIQRSGDVDADLSV